MKTNNNVSTLLIELSEEEVKIFIQILELTEGILKNEKHEELAAEMFFNLKEFINT